MTEAVVDHLKTIEVKEEDSKQVVFRILGPLHRMAEPIHEQDAIGQARQSIGHFAFSDVSLGTSHARGFSVAAPNANPPAKHPAVGPVLVQHAMFIFIVRRHLLEMGSEVRLYAFNILGMDPVKPFTRSVSDFVLLVPKHGFPAGGIVQLVSLQVPVPQTVVGAENSQRIALFTLAEGFFGSFVRKERANAG